MKLSANENTMSFLKPCSTIPSITVCDLEEKIDNLEPNFKSIEEKQKCNDSMKESLEKHSTSNEMQNINAVNTPCTIYTPGKESILENQQITNSEK